MLQRISAGRRSLRACLGKWSVGRGVPPISALAEARPHDETARKFRALRCRRPLRPARSVDEVTLCTSPECFHARVFSDVLVRRENRQRVHLGERHEHPVERIAMDERKIGGGARHARVERELA